MRELVQGRQRTSMKHLTKEESAVCTSTATKQGSSQHCQMAGFGWVLVLCFTLYSNWGSTRDLHSLIPLRHRHILTPRVLLSVRVYKVHVSPPYSAMACLQVQFKMLAWIETGYVSDHVSPYVLVSAAQISWGIEANAP